MTEATKTSLHFLKSGEKDSQEIVELRFSNFNFLPDYYFCAAFLDSIKRNFKIQMASYDDSFLKLMTLYGRPAVRVTGDLRRELYEHCNAFKGCSLRFPFSLFYPSKVDFRKLTPVTEDDYCRKESLKTTSTPREVLEFNDVFEVKEIFDIREREIIPETINLLKSQNWSEVYISTMTFSPSFLDDLVKATAVNKTKVNLIFSFGIQSLIKDFPSYLYELPPNIILHPVYPSSEAPSSYHLKGAFFVGKISKFLFFSGNFRNYDEKSFSDLAMVANVKKPEEVKNFFNEQLWENCQGRKYFDCSLKARFENNSSARDLLTSIAERQCKLNKPPPGSIAYTPRNHDLKKILHGLMGEAQRSIFFTGHQINDRELFNILDQRNKKGVEILGLNGRARDEKAMERSYLLRNITDTEYHSKFAVIDEKVLIWSTGNFTGTAYQNPWEMTFIIRDVRLINTFKQRFMKLKEELRDPNAPK